MGVSAAHLEVVAGKAAGMSIIVEDELQIGRHADGAGRLADDEEISRAHARVTLDASGFWAIEDLGSTNGTFVNGLRISAPQTLSEGDTIELGATTLVVRELPSPVRDEAPAPVPAPGMQPTVIPGVEPEPAATADEGESAAAAEPASVAAPPPLAVSSPAPQEAPSQGAPPPPPEAEPVAAEPAAAPPEPVASDKPPPPLAIRMEIDFAAREARVVLNEASEPLRLVLRDGVWRPAAPTG
jgi:predicted component of type VI protein secretion system